MSARHDAEVLVLDDGRRLGYAEHGRRDGEPFFYFHGHPGCRLEASFAEAAAAQENVRIVALDRPGYGLSDFKPHRTMLDWPDDVREAADLLHIDRFSVVGASAGGPYALACAYRLPQRIVRAAVLSGVGPYGVPGITQGMRWQNRVGLQWAGRMPALAGLMMRSMHRGIRRRPARTIEALARAMSAVDAGIVLRPDVREILIADLVEAFRQGSRGAAADLVLLGRPWGFSLQDVKTPVYLWQGEADVLVPPAMGRYQAAQIPNCRAHFLAGEGHLLVINHILDVIRTLCE